MPWYIFRMALKISHATFLVEFIVDNRGVPAGNNKAISGMEEILPAY